MTTLSRLARLSLLVALAAPAAAQPQANAGGEHPSALVLVAAAPNREAKTLGKAQTYSLVGTLVPVGAGVGLMIHNASDNAVLAGALLTLAGGVVGPSAGHVYLGDARRAAIGIGLRTAGVGAGILAGAYVAQNDPGWFAGLGEFVIISGAALVVGSLYNFCTLDDSARERGLVVAPTVGARGRPALSVAMRL